MTATLTKQDVEKMSGPELVQTYNSLTGEKVERFSDRGTGIKRVLAAIGQGQVVKTRVRRSEPGPERLLYRPTTTSGKLISKLREGGGASAASLRATAQCDEKKLVALIRGIERQHGVTVSKLPSGNLYIDRPMTPRKLMNLAAGEQKPPREGSKREKVLNLVRRGATFDEITKEMNWVSDRTREALQLLSRSNGYGITESEDGRLSLAK